MGDTLRGFQNGTNCTPPAIDDFPGDLFTTEQRQAGAVIIHITISLYLFLALAVVCDKYFVPAVEKISQALNMSSDICGATFMAGATSSPELFVNVIGTFITEGDIGIGTIVGSAVFNILAVAACCGIGAGIDIPLDWWPLTRDCLAYGFTVAVLICIIHDERVEWYEALILVLLYIVYIGVMYFDKTIQKWARGGVAHARRSQRGSLASKASRDGERSAALTVDHFNQNGNIKSIGHIDAEANVDNDNDGNAQKVSIVETSVNEKVLLDKSDIEMVMQSESKDLKEKSDSGGSGGGGGGGGGDGADSTGERFYLFRYPTDKRIWQQLLWIIIWPVELVFVLTIPNCEQKRFKNLFPLTFLMCIVWIGSLSYLVAWMITIVGNTFNIPDSVMGITFLAAGTSVPEAVSSVIVAKQGHGSMGISNSIGSNTFDILLCLGLPWLIKASFLPISPGNHWVGINSHGLEYSAISLLSTLLLLYIAFSLNKFKLDRKLGNTCLLMYAVFLVLATLIELNVFFRVNLPACIRAK